MAYTAGNLAQLSHGNGFKTFRYDTTDDINEVEDAGYFNNKDDDLNLAVGDLITVVQWATAVRTGTISQVQATIVTNVISNDAAAAAGAVNIAEYGGTGAVSSGD